MAHKVTISHPDKILFPKLDLTKKDIISFYQDISEFLLFHLKNRPLVLQRYIEGIDNPGFYQQEVPDYYPDWIDRFEVIRKEKGKQNMLEIHTKAALKYVVNQDGICFHTWLSLKKQIKKPDLLVYDLDPPDNDFKAIVIAAKQIKKLIENLGGTPFVMTTGSSGLHILTPIKPKQEFDTVRSQAKVIAEKLIEEHPKSLTLEIRKNKREGRVFIDFLRNSFGQTTISPYSLRAAENAPIATPLEWDELSDNTLNSQTYTIKNILQRLSKIEDPFKNINKHRCDLDTLILGLKK